MATDTMFEVDDLESSPEIERTDIRTAALQNTSPIGTNVWNEEIDVRKSPIAIITLHSNTVFKVNEFESTKDEGILMMLEKIHIFMTTTTTGLILSSRPQS